jgi:citrate synthase
VFLGVVEDTARFLDEMGDDVDAAVARELEAGRRIPGLGHPVHKVQDPRTPRIYAIAEETGQLGPHLRRLRELAEAHRRQTGRDLPINGAGVAGAALADLGFPIALLRGFALLARTAGLLGHLAEEMEHPLGMPLYREVDERAKYVPPTGE